MTYIEYLYIHCIILPFYQVVDITSCTCHSQNIVYEYGCISLKVTIIRARVRFPSAGYDFLIKILMTVLTYGECSQTK